MYLAGPPEMHRPFRLMIVDDNPADLYLAKEAPSKAGNCPATCI